MKDFKDLCKTIRKETLNLFVRGGRGHLPSAYSLVEILVTLYYYKYNLTPADFESLDRHRIILSKGHGCLSLYAILKEKGFFDESEYDKLCKVDGILGGHPSRQRVPGIEFSTGSLGHGLPVAVGMACSNKKNKSNKKVVAILGDGECNEGTVWEAALSASKNKLDNLIVIIDYNKLQSYGSVSEVCPLEPFPDKWRSFGFDVAEVDMVNSSETLLDILNQNQNKPLCIICHTIKGQGLTMIENDLSWHHKNKLTVDEIKLLYKGIE